MELAAPLAAGSAAEAVADRVRGELVAVTGGTGRTGVVLIEKLLKLGCTVRVLTRSKERGLDKLGKLEGFERVELIQGEADGREAAQLMLAAGAGGRKVDRIYYCAGGEKADPHRVNNVGVGLYAEVGKASGVKQIVVVSSAWSSKPYSILALIVNVAMAGLPSGQHQVGEELVRKSGIDYAIVRAARIFDDEVSQQVGVKLDQGDRLGFFEGGKGMTVPQLAEVCLQAARHVDGRVTFEVMGDPTSQSGLAAELGPKQFGLLRPDGPYAPLPEDPLVAHQRAANVCKCGCGLALLVMVATIVVLVMRRLS